MTPIADGVDESGLAALIERSSELKHDLVEFAYTPRLRPHLMRRLQEAADDDEELDEGEELGEGELIEVVDRFVLEGRLPGGKTVLNLFLASRRDLSVADGEMVRSWGDFVEGLFENRGMDGDAVIFLNLLDDLKYRVYSNMGPAVLRRLPKRGFVYVRLVPVRPGTPAWLVSGMMRTFARSDAAKVAQVAIQLAANAPERVFRNPEKVEQGWKMMREDRAAFVGFFGTDELVLPPTEAAERMRAYYRHRQETQLAAQSKRGRPHNIPDLSEVGILPPEMEHSDTVGLIYDEVDGLNYYDDYGMLRDLFADPGLAADRRYASVLRGYLASDTIGPLPFRRLVAAYPSTADAVFRKILRKPTFTWAEHGEALLRRRKPWYYESEPRPGISVIGDRLAELTGHQKA